MPFQLEDVHYPLFASQVHHIECKLLEDAVVTILIGGSKGSLGNRLTPQAKVVAL